MATCSFYFSSTYDRCGSFTILKGLWWTFRYNFGTLAFGSLILTIISFVRLLFEYIHAKVGKGAESFANTPGFWIA